MEEAQTAPARSVTKHRACDECRSRKLACTKEPSGCSRCRREGLACHYSAQKPMGRPRKRRQVEDDEDVAVAVVARRSASTEDPSSASNGGGQMSMPALGAQQDTSSASTFFASDPTLAFLDEPPASNIEFLDVLPNNFNYVQHPSNIDPQIFVPDDGAFSCQHGTGMMDDLAGNFDPDPSTTDLSKDFSANLWSYWSKYNIEPIDESAEPSSSDVSNSAGSPEEPLPDIPAPSDPKPMPSIACGCLSTLYLALDSLSRLPQDISSAMRVARHATKVSYEVIGCPYCGSPLINDAAKPAPIQCLQNLMCLAALVPSACNAYAAILQMVETETASAKQDGRTIWFSFREIGGIWATIGENHGHCPRMQAYNNRYMEPDQWRTTMRAILRLDVYGLGEPAEDINAGGYVHYGLKDIVKLLEDRSEKRHAKMDALHAQGKMPAHQHLIPGGYRPVPTEERNCIRVLEAARLALDMLVIA